MISDQLFCEERGAVRVKICGITCEEQARALVAMRVDALGFNFWNRSKRFLPPSKAGWLTGLAGQVLRVGVFVNAGADEIAGLLHDNLIDWAQLHGDESPEFLNELLGSGWRAFKAIGIRNRESIERIGEYEGSVLLDAYAPSQYGGSGACLDWALGAEAVSRYPEKQIILAGGLTPDNVARAVAQVQPAGVDVASGVESAPGIKDLELCRRFIRTVHN